jgi:hypothetical protein
MVKVIRRDNDPLGYEGVFLRDSVPWRKMPLRASIDEATRNRNPPWAARDLIATQVVGARVEIVYTDTGFDRGQQFDSCKVRAGGGA